jgi:EAL domain-containing protein (putative c-di-GMP-specific phosphodiesterase class I)
VSPEYRDVLMAGCQLARLFLLGAGQSGQKQQSRYIYLNWRRYMPLQHLVEYFNDRFAREHRSSLRPFILENGKVSGLFGPIRISSLFAPLRQTLKPAVIAGHIAQIKVETYEAQHLHCNEIENLLAHNLADSMDFESIINFDRLSRTVHMLNYLSLSTSNSVLFLDVNPRHILVIKQDHGAYFEEVIVQCGLETRNIVIIMAVNSEYARYYQELLKGLDNYRHRGYKIALKFDYLIQESQAFDLIEKLSPDYVSLSARYLDQVRDSTKLAKLQDLKKLVVSIGGQSVLQQIDQKKSELLAINTGFDWVQGDYYEYSSCTRSFSEVSYSVSGRVY